MYPWTCNIVRRLERFVVGAFKKIATLSASSIFVSVERHIAVKELCFEAQHTGQKEV